MHNLKRVKIKSNINIADNAYLIRVTRSFDFVPGQIVAITNNINIPPRLYSICSENNSEDINVLYTVKAEGELTPRLEELLPGDKIWMSEPQGNFIFNGEPAWWIATGTGIAPFYSMLLSGQVPNLLVHGARNIENLYFKDEIEDRVNYIGCCSKCTDKSVFNGRVTDYLNGLSELPQNINCYICGGNEMVMDVRNILISKGVNFSKIITEIYF